MGTTEPKSYLVPTQVQLTAEQRDWVRRIAQETGRSQAELHREALELLRERMGANQ